MAMVLDALSAAFIVAGVLGFLAGTVGLLRFPDTLCRLHAVAKTDNLAVGLIVIGLLPQVASVGAGLKLLAVWLLLQVSGATVAQLIAAAARQNRPAMGPTERPGERSGRQP